MSSSRSPGQRAGLDRAQVLAAARGLLAEGGARALSVRAVARRLGVAPNALYSHVASRDELLDTVLDDVLAEVPLPERGMLRRDPVRAVRTLMLNSYDVLLRHQDLVPLYLERQGSRGARAQRLGDSTLEALRLSGLDEQAAQEAMRVLIVHTIGFAAFSARPSGSGAGPIAAPELRGNFEQGLDWLLAAMAPWAGGDDPVQTFPARGEGRASPTRWAP